MVHGPNPQSSKAPEAKSQVWGLVKSLRRARGWTRRLPRLWMGEWAPDIPGWWGDFETRVVGGFWGDMLENMSYSLHARYWSTFELIWDFGGNCWQISQTGYGYILWVMGIEFSESENLQVLHLIVKSWFPVDFPIHQSIDWLEF